MNEIIININKCHEFNIVELIQHEIINCNNVYYEDKYANYGFSYNDHNLDKTNLQ